MGPAVSAAFACVVALCELVAGCLTTGNCFQHILMMSRIPQLERVLFPKIVWRLSGFIVALVSPLVQDGRSALLIG